VLFLRELHERQQVPGVSFLVDDAHHLKSVLDRLDLRFRSERRGNPNAIGRVFRGAKRRTPSLPNPFSNAQLPTADSWVTVFVGWSNRC
jgi:putative transposase